MKRLVLASQSPRRQDLLKQAGLEFRVVVHQTDEQVIVGEQPHDFLNRIVPLKANVNCGAHDVVISADTIVVCEGQIFGKPTSEDDARRMLTLLSGREHQVMTGYYIKDNGTGKSKMTICETSVTFFPLHKDEIETYVLSKEPFGKAGSYAIQGGASVFVDHIEGCYFNIVGLPVSRVVRDLLPLLTVS